MAAGDWPSAGHSDGQADDPRRPHGKTDSIRVSLGTRDPGEVKVRQAMALAYVERVFTALRGEAPVSLTNRQATALAGEILSGDTSFPSQINSGYLTATNSGRQLSADRRDNFIYNVRTLCGNWEKLNGY
jgi:hypothetical protein